MLKIDKNMNELSHKIGHLQRKIIIEGVLMSSIQINLFLSGRVVKKNIIKTKSMFFDFWF